MEDKVAEIFGFSHPKERLFLRKEYNTLKGKKQGVLMLLSIIIFVSLLSIVLGKAGLDHLSLKMNDPFIKWFNIPVGSYQYRDDYEEIKKFLEKSRDEEKLGIEATSGSYRGLWEFYLKESRGKQFALVQGLNYWKDSLLLNGILDEKNLVSKFYSELNSDLFRNGIIITENFQTKLGADGRTLESNLVVIEEADNLKLRVLAVAKTLPNKSDVLCLNELIYCVDNFVTGEPEIGESMYMLNDHLILEYRLSESEGQSEDDIERMIKDFLNEFGLRATKISNVNLQAKDIAHNKSVRIELESSIETKLKRRIQRSLNKKYYKYNPSLVFESNLPYPDERRSQRYGVYDYVGRDESMIFDLVSFKIDLDSISTFQEVAMKEFEIELDMDQAEAKKNYGIISFLTIFLILTLVFFAGFAIIVYLYNLVKGHLNRIKMNLGTFLAFGMSKKFLMNGYMYIIFRLLATSTIQAVIVLILLRLAVSFFDVQSFADKYSFLFELQIIGNYWMWMTIFMLFGISYVLFRNQLKRFLSLSPGDLIYGR